MGVGDVPAWIGVLEAAKDWGVPPWEVLGVRPNRTLWFLRWSAYKSEMQNVLKDKQKHG
jgi:hypothetical protein